MKYTIFYTGLASTPNSIGLLCTTTGEKISEISTSCPKGKDTRKKYNKIKTILTEKYCSLL